MATIVAEIVANSKIHTPIVIGVVVIGRVIASLAAAENIKKRSIYEPGITLRL